MRKGALLHTRLLATAFLLMGVGCGYTRVIVAITGLCRKGLPFRKGTEGHRFQCLKRTVLYVLTLQK